MSRLSPTLTQGLGLWVGGLLGGLLAAHAGSIDTGFLEQPWPKQTVREFEVDKYAVRWRQKANAREGIFAGARFVAPSDLRRTWDLATDYTDLGTMTPGVSAIQFLTHTPTHQVIQVDVTILWKDVRLVFDIEQEPPEVIRFRLVNPELGEYRGICRMQPAGAQTAVELATWLQPAVRVPIGLILWAERVVLLKGIRNFLETCEQASTS